MVVESVSAIWSGRVSRWRAAAPVRAVEAFLVGAQVAHRVAVEPVAVRGDGGAHRGRVGREDEGGQVRPVAVERELGPYALPARRVQGGCGARRRPACLPSLRLTAGGQAGHAGRRGHAEQVPSGELHRSIVHCPRHGQVTAPWAAGATTGDFADAGAGRGLQY
jgi:hypothetical protein